MSNRGASIALGYVLIIAITGVLIGALIIAGGSFVSNQQDLVVDEELTVVGNQIAGNLEQADRLVRASKSDDPTVMINESFQQRVSGSHYTVELQPGAPPQLVLSTTNPDISTTVNLSLRTQVEESSVNGGSISVYLDPDLGTDGRLVITDA